MKPKKLKSILKKENIEMIDVRERNEYRKGSKIKGAKNIPMGQVFVDASKGKLPKNRKIVVICQKGGRCQIVAKELKKKGYDIEALEGGVEAWNETQE